MASKIFLGFVINEKTLDYIRTIPEPLNVVSVAGLYRTGKSYLLNKMLLNNPKGFNVGPTIEPCTKVNICLLRSTLFYINYIGSLDLGKTFKRKIE